ncbi:hypothetical protein SSX86_007229 [Deinandra increscens subsp. villosa]|uniref:Uncharacterized protein n=1 Tax=Deinandra increscens subsp. villosa TaxID=3103831 RepID=A0AAP0DHI2_9ASTR
MLGSRYYTQWRWTTPRTILTIYQCLFGNINLREEKYQQYVNSLTERIRTCDGILQQVTEKQRLVEFAESLRTILNYFDELENVSLELEPLEGYLGLLFRFGVSRFDDSPYLPPPSSSCEGVDHWCFFDEKTKDCAKMNNSGEETVKPIILFGILALVSVIITATLASVRLTHEGPVTRGFEVSIVLRSWSVSDYGYGDAAVVGGTINVLRWKEMDIETIKSLRENGAGTMIITEKSEVFPLHFNAYTPPGLHSNLSGPTDNRGTSSVVRMFPSDKANHAPVSSGSFQNPSNVVHTSATNSRTLP